MEHRDGAVGTGRVRSRARRLDAPLSAVVRAFSGPRVVFSDPTGPDVVGCGVAATVTASGADRFDVVRQQAEELLAGADAPEGAPRPRLLGGFAFHDDHDADGPWSGFPAARFVLPRVQAVREDGTRWLVVNDCDGDDATLDGALDDAVERVADVATTTRPSPGVTAVERTPGKAGWHEQVRGALARIDAGDLEKVVLAQRLTATLRDRFEPADALDRLGDAYPDCYRFAVEPPGGGVFFGATPETLVAGRGDRVETEALAGSIGRGGTPAEDDRLARQLVESPKVRHEHGVVAETVADQLGPLAAAVTVGDRSVRKLGNVQHLRTPIKATLDGDTHVLSVVAALHPTPAVGGRPPEAASATIRATETFERGWYAAPVGWFDAAGDGTFAVGIRSAVAREKRAHLFAGNGIVTDSDPVEEYDELQLKYRPILDVLR